MIEVLVLYYSSGGSVKTLANLIARGVDSVDGVGARIRTVAPVSKVCETIAPEIPEDGHPYIILKDLSECQALALGSPVRFGNMSAHLKYFLDSTSQEWLSGSLVNKPACVFTSSGSMHGGQEACLLSMMIPLIHHGMIMVGLPYTEAKLMITTTGCGPYGVTHVAGFNDDNSISEDEKHLAIAQGKRLATIALKLNKY
ncbi:MAG: NAD(P)H:quinone oxidoreductase [Burkholderiales bacterium]|nr:NAD(P)H:quinone oxidoreductase [Burkholderiales bacterium]